MLSREYIALESINSGFFNGIRGEHNYNKNLFSLLSKVDDDRFMGNWRVRFNQINTGTIDTSNKCLALYDVIHFNCNPEKLYSFLFDDFQCTFEKLLGENFDSASQKIHGNEVFNILQEELKLPSDSSSLNQNKSTIPLPTQPVPSVLDNQENKLSFVPYDGEGWFSKNKNFYITYSGKSYALKIGTSPEKLTLMDQTYIDSDRIQDQKIFQIKIIYH